MKKNFLFIHPTALIHSDCNIGKGTKIWANVQIRENVKIGKNCIISKDVYVDKNLKIGNFCKIQNGVSIYDGVEIFDKVFVGPHVCFTNDKVPRAFNNKWKLTRTKVCQGASIGANSTIVCGIVIGKYAMIAAGSVVTKNVKEFTLVAGNPAVEIAKINKKGFRVKNLYE
jgi:UDP-2-acetamido-3-amino-2,3-dideoxy-glucuronate N-acetyltransferase